MNNPNATVLTYVYKSEPSISYEYEADEREVMIAYAAEKSEQVFLKIDASDYLYILNMNDVYGFARLQTKPGKSMQNALAFLKEISEVEGALPAMVPKEKGKKKIEYFRPNTLVVEFKDDKEAEKYINENKLVVIKKHKTPALYTISTKHGGLAQFSFQDSLNKLNQADPVKDVSFFRVDFEIATWATNNPKNYFYYYNNQWGIRYTTDPLMDANIHDAWHIIPDTIVPTPTNPLGVDTSMSETNTTRGNDKTIVCIADSGVYGAHQAFQDVNAAGAPESRLVAGVNFITGGSTDDTDGHGTALAGIVVARRNNAAIPHTTNYKVVGAAPKAVVMPLKIVNTWTSGFAFVDLVDAIKHIGRSPTAGDPGGLAVVNSATTRYIILIAFAYAPEDISTRNAINEAVGNNVLVVCSVGQVISGSGNDIGVTPVYPAAQTNVIAAGAVNNLGNRWTQSNHGSNVIGAPGQNIYTTLISGLASYGSVTGSSFAAAYTASIAALIWHRHHRLHGNAFVPPSGRDYLPAYAASSGYSVRRLITTNGVSAPATNFGFGRADAHAALADVT